jgi:DNA-binding NarL/FixJ family response regulator
MTDLLTVALTDDEIDVRNAYRSFFTTREDIHLVGLAANGREGVALYLEQRPDVMLMDLKMPVMSGIEALSQIREHDPNARVIALTTFATKPYITAALRAGAAGYLHKDSSHAEVIQAIHDAHEDKMPLSTVVRYALAQSFRDDPPPSVPLLDSPLSDREIAIIRFIAEGLTNREIGERLYISEASAKKCLIRLSDKLGTVSRVHTAVIAIQMGLIELPARPKHKG